MKPVSLARFDDDVAVVMWRGGFGPVGHIPPAVAALDVDEQESNGWDFDEDNFWHARAVRLNGIEVVQMGDPVALPLVLVDSGAITTLNETMAVAAFAAMTDEDWADLVATPSNMWGAQQRMFGVGACCVRLTDRSALTLEVGDTFVVEPKVWFAGDGVEEPGSPYFYPPGTDWGFTEGVPGNSISSLIGIEAFGESTAAVGYLWHRADSWFDGDFYGVLGRANDIRLRALRIDSMSITVGPLTKAHDSESDGGLRGLSADGMYDIPVSGPYHSTGPSGEDLGGLNGGFGRILGGEMGIHAMNLAVGVLVTTRPGVYRDSAAYVFGVDPATLVVDVESPTVVSAYTGPRVSTLSHFPNVGGDVWILPDVGLFNTYLPPEVTHGGSSFVTSAKFDNANVAVGSEKFDSAIEFLPAEFATLTLSDRTLSVEKQDMPLVPWVIVGEGYGYRNVALVPMGAGAIVVLIANAMDPTMWRNYLNSLVHGGPEVPPEEIEAGFLAAAGVVVQPGGTLEFEEVEFYFPDGVTTVFLSSGLDEKFGFVDFWRAGGGIAMSPGRGLLGYFFWVYGLGSESNRLVTGVQRGGTARGASILNTGAQKLRRREHR